MTVFQFETAGRILFGWGILDQGVNTAMTWGRRALVVCGGDSSRGALVRRLLEEGGLLTAICPIDGEPALETLEALREKHSGGSWDFVAAIGGGSVLDAGKAMAILLTNPGPVLEHLEIIGGAKPFANPSLPVVAIPTTSGTGAEVTRNAVLTSRKHGVKVSMRSQGMLPRLAVVDPELAMTMPPEVTAGTGLDAVTQLVECLVSVRATPMTDGLCREGLRRGANALEKAWRDGNDRSARESMAVASLISGIGLANAGLGAVHGLAGPIGGRFRAPHGMLCGALLPHVMRANIAALSDRSSDPGALHRYREVAVLLTGNGAAEAGDAVDWAESTCRRLQVPGLSDFGLKRSDIPPLAEQAAQSSSMKGNPVRLTPSELVDVLVAAL